MMHSLPRKLAGVICLLTAVPFLYLSGYALFFTGRIDEAGYRNEHIVEQQDNVLLGIVLLIAICLAILLFALALRRLPGKDGMAAFFAVVMLLGVIWIYAAPAGPSTRDSKAILSAAAEIIGGDYSALRGRDSYFLRYPFQTGYLFYAELLLRVFGLGNYRVLELMNLAALLAAYGAVLHICRRCFLNTAVQRVCMILLLLCVQPILFCTFLYGNLTGLALALWGAALLLRFMESSAVRDACAGIVLCAIAVAVKPNYWIAVVALVILLLLHAYRARRFLAVGLAAALVLASLGVTCGVQVIYENRAGVSLDSGTPQTAWLAMGLQEGPRAAGWYNRYADEILQECNYDKALASAQIRADILMRFSDFAADRAHASSFFHEKLVSQWNETSFESIWVSRLLAKGGGPTALSRAFYEGDAAEGLLRYMDAYTTLLYASFAGGLICIFIGFIRRREGDAATDLPQALLPLIVLGGFLYHMLFEAKSQYLLTYLPLMAPTAAFFLTHAAAGLTVLFRHRRSAHTGDRT